MKNIYKTAIILISLLWGTVSAQDSGQSNFYSVGVTTGWAEDGIASNINLNYHISERSYWQSSFMWNVAEDYLGKYKIPYHEFTLQLSYNRRILAIDKFNANNVFVGGGAVGGLELLNNGKKELYNGAIINQKSKFMWGGFVSCEGEFYLGADLYLAFQYNQYYHVNSDLGNWLSYVGVGIKYYLL